MRKPLTGSTRIARRVGGTRATAAVTQMLRFRLDYRAGRGEGGQPGVSESGFSTFLGFRVTF